MTRLEDLHLESRRYWKFTAGHTSASGFWDDFFENDRVLMGHQRRLLTSKYKSYEIFDVLKRRYEDEPHSSVPRQFRDLARMARGDVVVCKRGGKAVIVGIGFVKDNEIYRTANGYDGYPHARNVM